MYMRSIAGYIAIVALAATQVKGCSDDDTTIRCWNGNPDDSWKLTEQTWRQTQPSHSHGSRNPPSLCNMDAPSALRRHPISTARTSTSTPHHPVQRQHLGNHLNEHPASSASTYAQITLFVCVLRRAHRGYLCSDGDASPFMTAVELLL
ncbi:hypothetical protein C8J57DRAFT_1503828 [Mycena rebaudengoi]|nr:hypothetical protein C8J57DRAFT_1503828 [Mycena rebaudengoi]